MICHATPPPSDPPRIRPAHVGETWGPQTCCHGVTEAGSRPEATLPLVAEFNGSAVAGVCLTLAEDGNALIHGLWIDPAWAHTPLPLRLMVTILEEGRKLGCLKVDMDASVKGLAIVAMLLDSGLLMDRSCDESGDPASCYLNLYKKPSSVLA